MVVFIGKSVEVKTELVNLTSTSRQHHIDAAKIEEILYLTMYHKALELKEQVIERNPEQHKSADFIDKLESMRRKIIGVDKNCILLTVRCLTLEALYDLH